MKDRWIHEKLEADIGHDRYLHSVRVMETCIDLARHHGYHVEKVAIAGLLHDCGRLLDVKRMLKLIGDFDIILDSIARDNTGLIHAILGEELARREYHIGDVEVLNAIRFHTTGRENMNSTEKIVYIADIIEPNRNFPGVENIRDMAYRDIDGSILHSMEGTLKFLIETSAPIHLDTIRARNQLLRLKKWGDTR
ncbi:MAG: HD domain-containing protein [Tissierellia bacterium]|nr:HD domain-containing protein [Tissierellia bacterium]